MFTITFWVIYIKTAMYSCQNIYWKIIGKNKQVSITHTEEQTQEPITNFDIY